MNERKNRFYLFSEFLGIREVFVSILFFIRNEFNWKNDIDFFKERSNKGDRRRILILEKVF